MAASGRRRCGRGRCHGVYLTAGTSEPFFLENAQRWAEALADAGADVVLTERDGDHGDPFWQAEFPLMVAWAFPS